MLGDVSIAHWPDGVPFTPGVQVWVFPEHAVVFTHSTLEVPTLRDAHALVDMFLWLRRERPEIRDPVVVHDWRSVREFPRPVRQVFAVRRREIAEQPRRLIIAADVNPVLRMAIRTLALAAQVMSVGGPMEFVANPYAALAELGPSTPDAALHARLRASWRRASTR